MVRVRRSRSRARGVSLIELMVALVISLVLIGGAIQVYVNSRQNYDVNEAVVRLQENARYVLSIVEPDIRMANSWGLLKGYIDADASSPDTNCGADFARKVQTTLEGTNNEYTFGCLAGGGGAVATADTLIVRRASVQPASATSGRLLVCSTRTQARVVQDSASCTPAPTGQVNDLIVNAYYVSRDADHVLGLPTLRRFALSDPATLNDVEIAPGVEDMQIQFGIDSTGTSGTATRYVNADEVPATAQIVSVRLWLLVRSETPEQSFTDRTVYEYGDRMESNGAATSDLNDAGTAGRPYFPNDHFRRLLVSRTILIRNALGT